MRSSHSAALIAATIALACCRSGLAAEPFRYDGVCEASAAAILDEDHFAVASDDREDLTVYKRGNAAPLSRFVHDGVTDLEAAARIGDTIFWVTSHSLNKDDEDKQKRKVLFATSIASDGSLVEAGTVFRDLRSKVAKLLGIEEETLKASLNIEGLAATPDGKLLVGLRGPLTDDGRARVINIGNPFPLVGLESLPQSGTPFPMQAVSPLKLDGRGIRSIELVGTGEHTFLIVAGSVEDHGLPPALYWWNGDASHDPTPGPVVSFDGMTPEALIAWSDNDIQILGDNGDNCNEKKPDEKPLWFPSIDVKF